MSQLTILKKLTPEQLKHLVSQITANLELKQGFQLGESTVVSHYLHSINQLRPAEIQIFVNRDAGQSLLGKEKPSEVIHIDIFHEPAAVKIKPIVNELMQTMRSYLLFRQTKYDNIEPQLRLFYDLIFIKTGTDAGKLTELLSRMEEQQEQKENSGKKRNHVHLLLINLPPKDYALIPCLVDTIETELIHQGIEIRKVNNIVHVEIGGQQPYSTDFIGLKPEEHRLWSLSITLSNILSGPEDVIDLLQIFSGPFRRKKSLSSIRNKNGHLRNLILSLAEAGLIKRGWVFDTLTKEGKELLDFMIRHRQELDSQLRRMLRKVPVPQGHYRSVRHSHLKSRQKQYTTISKTTSLMKDSWMGSIAIPETMVQAAKNKFLQKRPKFQITREDIKVHKQEIKQPVDMCLLIDGSASMAGPKMKAMRYLVEHLFLATRDKIAIVVFQEREAKVAVPFTRNYTRLKSAMESLQPLGMTPLADGIVTALNLIKNRHAHNPLLILITDGIPTRGKWTHNAQDDALKAAEMVKETRAKLICMGVASNQEFLEELAKRSEGNVYILDNLEEHATLIEIVHQERKL
jgi:magnesium chelatase subunit D